MVGLERIERAYGLGSEEREEGEPGGRRVESESAVFSLVGKEDGDSKG